MKKLWIAMVITGGMSFSHTAKARIIDTSAQQTMSIDGSELTHSEDTHCASELVKLKENFQDYKDSAKKRESLLNKEIDELKGHLMDLIKKSKENLQNCKDSEKEKILILNKEIEKLKAQILQLDGKIQEQATKHNRKKSTLESIGKYGIHQY